MYQRGRTSWLKHLDFMLLDISSLFLSFAVAFVIRFPGQGNPFLDIQYRRIFAILILVSIVASLALNNLNYVLRRGLMQELNAVLLLAFGTLALVTIYMFSVQTGEIYSRLLIYYTLLIFTAVDYIVRVTWNYALYNILYNAFYILKKIITARGITTQLLLFYMSCPLRLIH